MNDLRTAAQQALAQQEQEPVAWMLYDGQAFETNRCDYHDGAEWTPLYTHPPRREWQSLTEEEIATINKEGARGSAIRRDGTTSYRIARAVEQALKERNNG